MLQSFCDFREIMLEIAQFKNIFYSNQRISEWFLTTQLQIENFLALNAGIL